MIAWRMLSQHEVCHGVTLTSWMLPDKPDHDTLIPHITNLF